MCAFKTRTGISGLRFCKAVSTSTRTGSLGSLRRSRPEWEPTHRGPTIASTTSLWSRVSSVCSRKSTPAGIGNRDPQAVLRSCFRNWFAGAFEVAVADIGDSGTRPVPLTARQKLGKLSARHRLAPIRNQADDSGGGAQLEREIGRQIKIWRRVVVEEQRMRQLKYGLPHHHVEKPDREQRAENRRQLEIQGAVAARDVEFGFHVKKHDRLIHANRDNDAEENRVFLPPPLHTSVKAAGKKNRECGEGDHVPEPCRHEPAGGAGQVPNAEDGIGDDGEAHRNPRPIDSVFCEIGPVLVFNGRVAEPEAEAGQKRGDRLRPESSAPGFGANAVSQNGRSFGLGGRLERHRSPLAFFGSFTRCGTRL